MIAGLWWPVGRSRFCAQFNRAPGNHRVPGIASSVAATSLVWEARTSKYSQIDLQKGPRWSTDQRHSEVKSVVWTPWVWASHR
jgi:hypothetical protein